MKLQSKPFKFKKKFIEKMNALHKVPVPDVDYNEDAFEFINKFDLG